jgi:hypothetical protein
MAKSKTQLVATIPVAGTDSDVKTVPFNGTLVGLFIPAGMVGTSLKFKASKDESATAVPIKKEDGTDYSITIGSAAAYHKVDPSLFEGVPYLTVISGASETGGVARVLTLVFGIN